MNLTPEEIEQVRTQLSAVANDIAKDENIDTLVDVLSVRVSRSYFGNMWALALAYLTAHTHTVNSRGGEGGQITSKKEGDLSVSFGSAGSGNALSATSYGQEYELLLKQCSPGMLLTSGPVFRGL